MTARSRLRLSVAAAALVLGAGMWCSSGTMAIYGATCVLPVVRPPCGYLANLDHPNALAPLRMLDGAPRAEWGWSVLLRRLLYPLLVWPLYRVLGFQLAGFITNVVLSLASLVAFALFLRRELGHAAAHTGAWLLASYPGTAYWAGLPYAYAVIVPFSLLLTMLLWQLQRAPDNRRRDPPSAQGRLDGQARAFGLALAAGVLFCGYDLFPFFGPAALVLLAWRRRWRRMPAVMAGMAAPLAALHLLLHFGFGATLLNSNSQIFYTVAASYFRRPDFAAWARLLAQLPRVALANFFFSGFVLLPSLFVSLWALARRQVPLGALEKALLAVAALVFLFNNLAPPYDGWQMRGEWIPRIYQPLFVPFIVYAARVVGCGNLPQRGLRALIAATVIGNALVVFGPVTGARPLGRLSSVVYARFYLHGRDDTLLANLDRFGRRPLGICAHGR
jgi:hypothetical protein